MVESGERDATIDAILGIGGDEDPGLGPTVPARRVVETVSRENLVAIQTPQVFSRELFVRAYAQDDLDGATDDAMLVERLGEPVLVVEGDPRNLKVTVPADLDMVRQLLGIRAPEGRPTHKRF